MVQKVAALFKVKKELKEYAEEMKRLTEKFKKLKVGLVDQSNRHSTVVQKWANLCIVKKEFAEYVEELILFIEKFKKLEVGLVDQSTVPEIIRLKSLKENVQSLHKDIHSKNEEFGERQIMQDNVMKEEVKRTLQVRKEEIEKQFDNISAKEINRIEPNLLINAALIDMQMELCDKDAEQIVKIKRLLELFNLEAIQGKLYSRFEEKQKTIRERIGTVAKTNTAKEQFPQLKEIYKLNRSIEKYQMFINSLHHGNKQHINEIIENYNFSDTELKDLDNFLMILDKIIEEHYQSTHPAINDKEFDTNIQKWENIQKYRKWPDSKIKEKVSEFRTLYHKEKENFRNQSCVLRQIYGPFKKSLYSSCQRELKQVDARNYSTEVCHKIEDYVTSYITE